MENLDLTVLSHNKWCSSRKFHTRFVRLVDDNTLADCEFVVGPQKTVIKGHKVLFCTASDVFKAMFLGDLKETKPVHVEDLEPDGFQAMKKYIYTCRTSFESVFEALVTQVVARKYLIDPLVQECVKFINRSLKPSQVLEFFDCCKLNVISTFDNLCDKFIREETSDVVKSDYLTSASIEAIEMILTSSSLRLESEMKVFDLFERWTLAEAERQGIAAEDIATSSIGKYKKHIRFLTISCYDFNGRVMTSPLLTSEEKQVIALNREKFDPNLTSENISMDRVDRCRAGFAWFDDFASPQDFAVRRIQPAQSSDYYRRSEYGGRRTKYQRALDYLGLVESDVEKGSEWVIEALLNIH